MSDMYERMHNRASERAAANSHVLERVLPAEIPGTIVGGVALVDERGNELMLLNAHDTAVLGAELQRQSRRMRQGADAAQRIADRRVQFPGRPLGGAQ